ncbi:hypothetical protein DLAC_02772, partial [Tieghemostelium lacteum]
FYSTVYKKREVNTNRIYGEIVTKYFNGYVEQIEYGKPHPYSSGRVAEIKKIAYRKNFDLSIYEVWQEMVLISDMCLLVLLLFIGKPINQDTTRFRVRKRTFIVLIIFLFSLIGLLMTSIIPLNLKSEFQKRTRINMELNFEHDVCRIDSVGPNYGICKSSMGQFVDPYRIAMWSPGQSWKLSLTNFITHLVLIAPLFIATDLIQSVKDLKNSWFPQPYIAQPELPKIGSININCQESTNDGADLISNTEATSGDCSPKVQIV